MKKLILILIIVISSNTSAQEYPKKLFYENFVECYYSKKTNETIFIYDSPNGEKVGALNQLTEKYCWYKFAISESKNGWLKIQNLLALPGCEDNEEITEFEEYKGKWVLTNNMIINIGAVGNTKIGCLIEKTDKGFAEIGYRFYDKPNSSSKIAFYVKGYTESELIEIHGTWAKLKIEHNGKSYIGWIQKKYHCAYPWTTCPVYD
jgi:hypothetical protein